MEIKICLLFTLIVYSIVVSQAFSYLISLRFVQLHLDADGYLRFRKLTDTAFRKNYQPVMYALIGCTLILTVMTVLHGAYSTAILATFSFVAVMADVIIAVKGNIPINNEINSWTATHIPGNWQQYRHRWLHIFGWRQVISIAGFISVLVMAVFFT